jgi:hypothetical protein
VVFLSSSGEHRGLQRCFGRIQGLQCHHLLRRKDERPSCDSLGCIPSLSSLSLSLPCSPFPLHTYPTLFIRLLDLFFFLYFFYFFPSPQQPFVKTHGFSSFKFIPWRETELVALKTEENGDRIATCTYSFSSTLSPSSFPYLPPFIVSLTPSHNSQT